MIKQKILLKVSYNLVYQKKETTMSKYIRYNGQLYKAKAVDDATDYRAVDDATDEIKKKAVERFKSELTLLCDKALRVPSPMAEKYYMESTANKLRIEVQSFLRKPLVNVISSGTAISVIGHLDYTYRDANGPQTRSVGVAAELSLKSGRLSVSSVKINNK